MEKKPPTVHDKEAAEDSRYTDEEDSVLRHWFSPPRETLENLLRTRIPIVENQGLGTQTGPINNWRIMHAPDCSETCNVHREVIHESDFSRSRMSFHGPPGIVHHLVFTYATNVGENHFIGDMSTADPQTLRAFFESYARSRHELGQNRVFDTLPGLFRALMVPFNTDMDQGGGATDERTHETRAPSSSQSINRIEGQRPRTQGMKLVLLEKLLSYLRQ